MLLRPYVWLIRKSWRFKWLALRNGKNTGRFFVLVFLNFIFVFFRSETGLTQRVLKAFDWTFCNDYKGSLVGPWSITPTEERIDLNKLKQKDAILFFDEVNLFEDELHDNGIAQLTVRVVSWFFFALFLPVFLIFRKFSSDFWAVFFFKIYPT